MNSVTVVPVGFLDLKPSKDQMRRDYVAGLRRSPKRLPSKYFYDAEGSALFDRICELPEYYGHRAEAGLVQENVDEITELIGQNCLLVELGSGNSFQSSVLLDNLDHLAAYVPLATGRQHLIETAQRLGQRYPHLVIFPLCVDYTQEFQLPVPLLQPRKTVFYYPGSALGNFEPYEAEFFLRRLWLMAGSNGGLLIGIDINKETEAVEGAYNDRRGLMSAFNKNILARANRELASNFELSRFEHLALYNEIENRVEMHLVSLDRQQVRIGKDLVWFADGESITTEHLYRYSPDEFTEMAANAGWRSTALWTDPGNSYSLHYLTAG